ncbi:MAG: helix-turn-helix domain-containing protein [Bacteroides sp.]
MEKNPELQLAWQFIENTGTHLFLTGKAGTGKTTFLRQLKEKSPKRLVVVAPTGIAAINAGGVTIHSFFQLPFAPFVPDTTFTSAQKFFKFGKEKINILRSMDLLVIDEISMVRADLLDAIDSVLRRYRDRYKPFGGVQLLMIGDLQQLAPVVRDEEWKLLSAYYPTAFFFGSRALHATEYVTIELQKVYRQTDEVFLGLLNKIRDKQADTTVLGALNKRYLPHFHPAEEEGYIRLTTHNVQAQRYNDRELQALPGQAFSFKADIEGLFPESAYVADELLTVKRGAQIMFIKNDSAADKKFYNGKIGQVMEVSDRRIVVRGNGDTTSFVLEKEVWTNSRYRLNPETKEITEEVEGTFKQYPIRLAWAITIHKSQGLTFERAIIDANASFAHGQVYVALSRCKTLEGLVLDAPLNPDAIIADEVIDSFTREAEAKTPDQQKLDLLQRQYFGEQLSELFGFLRIEQLFAQLLRLLDEHFYRLYPKLLERYKQADELFKTKVVKVADTFQGQYTSLVNETADYAHDERLQKRIVSGAHYFSGQLDDLLLSLLADTKIQTDNKDLKKKIIETRAALHEALAVKQGTLSEAEKQGFSITAYLKCKAMLLLANSEDGAKSSAASPRAPRAEKHEHSDTIEVPVEVLHIPLYKELIQWRNAEASRLGKPVYTIIQQKAVLGIVNRLPADIPSLVSIPYFGKRGADKYGEQLLAMVDNYVKRHNVQCSAELENQSKVVQPQQAEKLQPTEKPKQHSEAQTYALFLQGKNLEEIAQERELVTGTIAGHLESYIRSGEIKIEQLVERTKIDKILQQLQKRGAASGLIELKVALGDDVSYSEIKLVRASVKR